MYIPISRKYRPLDFDTIVGQDHVTKTLKNAITLDKVAHAYLFAGGRGVGKTTTARVFSKALNCVKGPTVKPCGVCVSCQEIVKGTSLDVLEIDGASNRGIDEIRNLRENVKLKPISGKYRIYILDEVHMLTTEAFNALLKTLEEPPSHVKFIFATTRPHKILPTILSRCQRFDFRMIPNQVIIGKLRQIACDEKLSIKDDALFLLAKNAGGSMRDAQVMLDQISSYTKGEISGQDVSKMLGILEEDILFRISSAIQEGDGGLVLDMVGEMMDSGKDALFIATTLIEHFRNILVIASCEEPGSYIDLNEGDRERLTELSCKFSVEELFYIIYTLSRTVDLIGKTALGKIPLEVALLKLSRKEKLMPLADLIDRIEKMESSLKNGNLPVYSPRPEITREIKKNTFDDKPHAFARKPLTREEIRNIKIIPANNADEDKEDEGEKHPQGLTLQRVKGLWPEIIRKIKQRKVSAGIYLEEGILLELKDNILSIGFSKSNVLHKEALESGDNKNIITGALKQFMDADFGLAFVFTEVQEPVKERIAGQTEEYSPRDNQSVQSSRRIEPIIKSAAEKFSGKIVKQYYVKEKR